MNNQDSTNPSPNSHPLPLSPQKLAAATDTSLSSPVVVPTPSVTSEPDEVTLQGDAKMEANSPTENDLVAGLNQRVDGQEKQGAGAGDTKADVVTVTTKAKADKKKNRPKKKAKRVIEETSDSDSDSESSDNDSDSDSDDEKAKRKKKRKLAAKRAAEKKKKLKLKNKEKANKGKGKKQIAIIDSSSSSSSSDSDSDDEVVVTKKARKKASKAKKTKKSKKIEISSDDGDTSSSSSSSSSDSDSEDEKPKKKQTRKKRKVAKKAKKVEDSSSSSSSSSSLSDMTSEDEITPDTTPEAALTTAGLTDGTDLADQVAQATRVLTELKLKQQQNQLGINTATMIIKDKFPVAIIEKKHGTKKNVIEFKRIDQIWDNKIRDYKLVESAAEQKDEFDCVFTVRRRFDWEGKHRETQVDIKSKLLRNALQEVFKDCKYISLVEDMPQIDPHTLFHYYDEICTYVKKTLKRKLKRARRSKDKKQLTQQIAQCKLLIGYIDEDYSSVRKALKPMLKAGTITYDLVWALFKPDTIVYTPTYGNKDDPRCFKVDFCYEYENWLTGGKSWMVDGRYLEYDGKIFGLGDHGVEIASFKGHRKITNLATYPLQYHKDPEGIKKQLIERGKRFVALQGMNYRFQNGIAYMKIKRQIAKFNINGRVMVDPAIFRRINPNYPLSYIKQDEVDDEDEDDDEGGCCGSGDDEDIDDDQERMRRVMWKDRKGKKHLIVVPESCLPGGNDNATQKIDAVDTGAEPTRHVFTEEELLIASPVVLGFSFSEKLWLEFSLTGIKEIEWNKEAFDSLVLPKHIKQNLKGLVGSHRFNAAKTIDDVIQGKGKGLNVVLHGPPGVGKTLTGESIAEYLKCPLYAVSAGELGTNSASLERDLNRIMDITHSWGAILLLDEADVFLEARQPHDIHRNSLVSVFLRLTEYYQGILFLTTNRVETFDEAFQSRIHMGIRYENLPAKARKKIWQHHVGKVEKMAGELKDEGHKVKPFKESDFDELSKKAMNGRQIKNAVKTSQSIALAEKEVFSMAHIKRVLEVAESFEDDMRGGKGYRDAMRQYT